MSNFKRTAKWLEACGKQPGNIEHLSVQIGCVIEEFSEFLESMGIYKINELNDLANNFKSGNFIFIMQESHAEKMLDAICDINVTIDGVAYLAGFDKDGADAAVLDSNDEKLIDGKPVIKPGGKIGKSDGWTPPNLAKFIK